MGPSLGEDITPKSPAFIAGGAPHVSGFFRALNMNREVGDPARLWRWEEEREKEKGRDARILFGIVTKLVGVAPSSLPPRL